MERDLRRIWTQYVLMYVGVAVLVMLLLMPIYHIAYQQTRNMVIQETQYAVQKNIDRLEMELISIEQYTDSLLSSEEAVHMAYLENINHYHMKLAIKLANQMLTSAAKHIFVDDIVILFPGGKYVVSRGKVTSNDNYYGFVIGYENYDRATFEDMLYRQRLPFFPVQTVKNSYYNRQVRAITLNYFGNTKENTYVAACVVLTEERLADILLTNSILSGGFLSVKDACGNELFFYGAERMSETECATLQLVSDDGMLQVEVGISESVFEKGISSVRNMIVLYSALAFLVAAVMAIVFGTRQYRPVRDYFCYVQSQGIDVLRTSHDTAVASLMTYSLKGLQFQRSNMLESIRQLKKHNQDMLLQNLFNGIDVQRRDIEKHLEDIPALNGSYLLVRVYIDGSISIADTEKLYGRLEDGIAGVFPDSYFLLRDANVAILPVSAQQIDDAYEQLTAISKEVRHYGQLVATMVCSALHSGVDELSVAYSEMRVLVRHLRVFTDERTFYRYDLIKEYTSNIKTNLFHPEDLLTMIQPGNEKHLHQWLQGFLQHLSHLSVYDAQRATAQYYGMVNILDDMSRKWNVPFSPHAPDPDAGYDAMADYLTDSVKRIVDTMMQNAKQHNEKHEILKYIDNHYQQPDICLSLLADVFKLSEAHISRIIKAQTGLTYSAYIESIRMGRAKELLESSDMTVKDIACSLGYENQSTFMKAFKRVYHMPPTGFRQGSAAQRM